MRITRVQFAAFAFAVGTSLVASALWVPAEEWYQAWRGKWTPSPKCETYRAELLERAGALAFAVSRNGIECGWDSEKATVNAVKLTALQICAGRGGIDCKVIYEKEAGYALSSDCKKKLETLQSKPTASAFAADKTGICGFDSDHEHLNDAIAVAMRNCQERNGYECKIVFSRERVHEPSPVCRALLAKLRDAKTPFAMALHKNGDCSAFGVEDVSKRPEIEASVVADCDKRYGAGCRIYASE